MKKLIVAFRKFVKAPKNYGLGANSILILTFNTEERKLTKCNFQTNTTCILDTKTVSIKIGYCL